MPKTISATKNPRRVVAVFTRELQRQISSERVAGDADGSEAVDVREFVHDESRVRRQSGVKEACREMLGVPAVSLVEPHDVHALLERLGRDAAHVVRVARCVEAVQQKDGRVFPRLALPVAVREDPGVVVDVEVSDGRLGQSGEISRVAPAEERHGVSARQRGTGNEVRFHR